MTDCELERLEADSKCITRPGALRNDRGHDILTRAIRYGVARFEKVFRGTIRVASSSLCIRPRVQPI